jgi:carbonic anhydrase
MTQKITPHEALAALKEGNARFVCGKTEGPNRTKKRRLETGELGQKPLAILVSCSDSRVPPEILFDMGIGDIFIIRVAGNICGVSEMGTIEYGVEHLHIPLIVVMGHSKCGAVTAVVKGEQVHGNLLSLAERIAPAVQATIAARPDLKGPDLVHECAKTNAWAQIEGLIRESPVVRKAAADGSVEIVAALYDIEHGDVSWMGKHPNQNALIQGS